MLIGEGAPETRAPAARTRPAAPARPAWRAAVSAAALGLYTTEHGERRSLALSIAKDLEVARSKLADELAAARREARGVSAASTREPESAIDDAVRSTLTELEKKLQGRAPQLI